MQGLSNREVEVYEMIGQGLTIQQIATRLHLSPKTIETHREKIKQKLNVKQQRRVESPRRSVGARTRLVSRRARRRATGGDIKFIQTCLVVRASRLPWLAVRGLSPLPRFGAATAPWPQKSAQSRRQNFTPKKLPVQSSCGRGSDLTAVSIHGPKHDCITHGIAAARRAPIANGSHASHLPPATRA